MYSYIFYKSATTGEFIKRALIELLKKFKSSSAQKNIHLVNFRKIFGVSIVQKAANQIYSDSRTLKTSSKIGIFEKLV